MVNPPRLARRFLELLAPEPLVADMLADLDEGFAIRARELGPRRARRWYWRQLFSLDWLRLRRELLSLSPAPPRRRRGRFEELMTSIVNDIRYAIRSFARTPGFTAVVVLTLALGIGANVALVSVVRSVLLHPLPYAVPDRVVSIWSQWAGFPKTWVSMGEYRVYRDSFESFDSVGLYYDTSANLTDGDDPERLGLAGVTPNVFETLGVEPIVGRGFTAEEAEPDISEVVVLSYRLWNRRYGADTDLLGSRIEVNGFPRTVIGILPPRFRLPIDFSRETPIEVYLPLDVPEGTSDLPNNGGNHSYYGVARLAENASVEEAVAEARAWNGRAVTDGVYPEEMLFRTLVIPVADDIVGAARSALWILLVAVGFVLLIACVNVANLVLSRGEERRREIALRTAMGANWRRIFRELMTESIVLAGLGGVAALLVAQLALRTLIALEPGSIPRLGEASLDGGALGFAALATLVTAVLFGVIPAFTSSRPRLRDTLTQGARGSSSGIGSQRFRGGRVAFQLAIAVVLVMAAGLMIRTFAHLLAIDPGFKAENVLTMRLSTPSATYAEDVDVITFYERLLERVRTLPGVENAGAVRILPLATQIGDWGTRIEGYEPAKNESTAADWQIATPGYFEVMRIPLVEGRTFTEADRSDSEPVVIVNESFANRYWPGESALGHRIMMRGADEPPWVRIVGIVSDIRHNGLTADVKGKWYRPHSQFHQSSGFTPSAMTLTIAASASVPAQTLAGPVRAVIREIDPKLPIAQVRSLEEVLSRSVAQSRFTMALLVLLSGLALVLAAVGVYGVISYVVSQRTKEFGIRLALGSSPSGVLVMVLQQGLFMSVAGVAVGAGVAVLVTDYMGSVLYGVDPRDPGTFALVPMVLLGAALLGCIVPALRASRVDPVVALRSD